MPPRISRAILAGLAMVVGVTGLCSAAAGGAARTPGFSQPSRITNPWLPLSKQRHWVLRGVVDGKRVRADKTLLRHTETFSGGG